GPSTAQVAKFRPRSPQASGARPGLDFLEQARVFNRDDGLVGERLEQFDLPVGEQLHPVASQDNCSERCSRNSGRHLRTVWGRWASGGRRSPWSSPKKRWVRTTPMSLSYGAR